MQNLPGLYQLVWVRRPMEKDSHRVWKKMFTCVVRSPKDDSLTTSDKRIRRVLPKHQWSTTQPPSHRLDKASHDHWAGTDTERNHSEASVDESAHVLTKHVALQRQAPIQPTAWRRELWKLFGRNQSTRVSPVHQIFLLWQPLVQPVQLQLSPPSVRLRFWKLHWSLLAVEVELCPWLLHCKYHWSRWVVAVALQVWMWLSSPLEQLYSWLWLRLLFGLLPWISTPAVLEQSYPSALTQRHCDKCLSRKLSRQHRLPPKQPHLCSDLLETSVPEWDLLWCLEVGNLENLPIWMADCSLDQIQTRHRMCQESHRPFRKIPEDPLLEEGNGRPRHCLWWWLWAWHRLLSNLKRNHEALPHVLVL